MNKTMKMTKPAKREPVPMNGVNTPVLLATINAVAAQPELAKFQFSARNEWMAGTHSRSTMQGFFGAGAQQMHASAFMAEGDHPQVLVGADHAPTPVEWLLHALATCLTAGIGNIAAARGIKLNSVRSTVRGDIDLRGLLGISNEVRNGFHDIAIEFEIDGDASEEDLEKVMMQSKARSAVFDVLTNGVRVTVTKAGTKTGAMPA